MEEVSILSVLRTRAWTIGTLCVVAMVGGYIGTYFLVERYAATALVLVRPQQPAQLDERNLNHNLFDFPITQSMSVETPSKTYIEIIKSESLIRKVVEGLDVEGSEDKASGLLARLLPPAFFKAYLDAKTDLAQLAKDTVSILKYGRIFPKDALDDATKEVSENLTLKSLEDTFVFQIEYAGKSPQFAAEVANRLAKSFVETMEQLRRSDAQQLRDAMLAKLEATKDALARARLGVESNVHMRTSLQDLKSQELELKSAEADYQSALKDFKDADKNLFLPLPELRIVSEAAPPRLPTSPLRIKFASIALLGGLMVGVILAFFLEYVNQRVRGVADVEDHVGVKVLATLPRVSPRRLRAAQRG